ncbi:MAG: YidB family protein [Granulosicoccus sp.]
MDLLKMGQDLLGDKMGDAGGIMEALSGLTSGEGLDIGGIAEKLKEGGLGDQVSSWMGDGENAPVSADQITNALGADKIGEMASKLGVDAGSAAETLSQAVPSLMDKLSSGGNLLDSVTSGNPLDMAKNLFK